ncbi:MAG: hypothetical protein UZ14_CFX002000270 [Chloroflexi bacterium OLB14]|nr:MAG: hypothetical protein UZ14_CFX002000270 [Chloroflexi bacterium OLB14]
MSAIPISLKPFFQEYDINKLSAEKDAHTIIERVLQFGNRQEIKWLFSTYASKSIIEWINQFGEDKLPQPHLNFWQIVLDIKDE